MKGLSHSFEKSLNGIIDNELAKPISYINDNLIMECCNGLLRIDNIEKYYITEKEVQKNINFLKQTNNNSKKLKKTGKILLLVAITAVILAVVALGYLQSKYDILDFSDHSTVFWNNASHKKVEKINIGYLPDGFLLADETKHKESIILSYCNGKLFFDVEKNSAYEQANINTEFKNAKKITLYGINYILFGESKYGMGIIWNNNGYQFLINGNISEAELVKIALSVS